MKDGLLLNGHAAPAPAALEEQPTSVPLALQLQGARKKLGEVMSAGLHMDVTPATNPNLLFAMSHDGAIIEALIELLKAKGVFTDDEVGQAVLLQLNQQITRAEANNEALRHRIVIAPPGKG